MHWPSVAAVFSMRQTKFTFQLWSFTSLMVRQVAALRKGEAMFAAAKHEHEIHARQKGISRSDAPADAQALPLLH